MQAGAGIEGGWGGRLQSSFSLFSHSAQNGAGRKLPEVGSPEPQTSPAPGEPGLWRCSLLPEDAQPGRSPSSMANSSFWGEPPWSKGRAAGTPRDSQTKGLSSLHLSSAVRPSSPSQLRDKVDQAHFNSQLVFYLPIFHKLRRQPCPPVSEQKKAPAAFYKIPHVCSLR